MMGRGDAISFNRHTGTRPAWRSGGCRRSIISAA